ncbi:acetylglutamate kinase [Fulvivirga ulvae]|uniref:acetylglutamate kinase n=1 Tax=Fulvivirga ulvae TaxID=2904245 RepID=UPI001F34EABF|nr:acetylglutamate kinase [Fulvivirga ulvae]UII32104.1 acetylglutamate kinase [Fulvivirga ulvae]
MEEKNSKSKPIIVIKYGGNAMVSENLQRAVLKNICTLKSQGYAVVIVHGGGPFIQEILDQVDIKSEFIHGHRKTSPEALRYVEMALKGRVNGEVVNLINSLGQTAVGLSGRDGKIITAKRYYHEHNDNGNITRTDLGQVGEVSQIDPRLIYLLLEQDFIPVITCIATDEEGNSYNINADLFAGSLAGHLNAQVFGVLTDVDGLMRDINDSDSLIREISLQNIKQFIDEGVIKGGMIPKTDACRLAVEKGASRATIINGKKPEQILSLMDENQSIGTTIKL